MRSIDIFLKIHPCSPPSLLQPDIANFLIWTFHGLVSGNFENLRILLTRLFSSSCQKHKIIQATNSIFPNPFLFRAWWWDMCVLHFKTLWLKHEFIVCMLRISSFLFAVKQTFQKVLQIKKVKRGKLVLYRYNRMHRRSLGASWGMLSNVTCSVLTQFCSYQKTKRPEIFARLFNFGGLDKSSTWSHRKLIFRLITVCGYRPSSGIVVLITLIRSN